MIQIQTISKQYGSKVLFNEANAFVGVRSKIALIGPNGAGKTTLIKMILGQESVDSGIIARPKNLTIGHLAQEVPKSSAFTILQETMRLDGRRELLHKTKEEYENKFALNPNEKNENELIHYGRILEELEHLDEYRLESRAKEILSGMGFREKDFHRNLSEFSGGWLMRVALSRVLLSDPDLLILDEPTNHLDLESLLWLEEFLLNHAGAALIVSHDRAFLNRIVDEVFEVDQKKINAYKGNIDSYVTQKKERLEILRAQYAGQQSKIAEIEAFVARFGAKATKARQAQSRLKQLEKMDLIEMPDQDQSVRFRFPPAPHSGKEVVTIKNAAFGYDPLLPPIFDKLDWILQRGSRVAIVGVNGAGKTTLLKLIAGVLPPTQGSIIHGHQVQVGYYAQMQAESLNLSKSILEELRESAPNMPTTHLRGVAGAFLFSGDAVEKKCGVLSGGEKARVALAKLLLTPTNFLILDEPTNHLDAQSKEVLLEALENFEGTLILVSHDREFVAPLVDTLLEIEPIDANALKGTSKITHLIEDYPAYLARKMRESAASSQLKKQSGKSDSSQKNIGEKNLIEKKSDAPSNNQLRTWQREFEKSEKEIVKIEKRLADILEEQGKVETYSDKERFLKLSEEQRKLEAELSAQLTRWEELGEKISR